MNAEREKEMPPSARFLKKMANATYEYSFKND